jgi:hypothetical protein
MRRAGLDTGSESRGALSRWPRVPYAFQACPIHAADAHQP